MKDDIPKQRIRFHFRFHNLLLWPLIMIIFCSAGCSFKKLKKDLQERRKMAEISGVVASESATHAPIMLLLLTSDPMQPRVVLYRVQAKPDKFNFIVTPGTYQLFAYEDLNRDQKHQDNERIGRSEQIKVTSPEAKFSELTILIPDKADPELLRDVDEIKSKGKVDLVNSKRHTGKIISLDEPFLDKKFVTMGLWQPLKFINEVPFGIFFMEEFKSDKIPVLFIHGINGSPRFFKEIITNL
ncbi:MAG: hypothetical protein KAG92_06570, partial [Deltaproteobacteria bacterium]|nr:hypothetical protein [Deltaproteobacteria bacterium]